MEYNFSNHVHKYRAQYPRLAEHLCQAGSFTTLTKFLLRIIEWYDRIYLRQIRYWSFTRGYCAVPYDNGLGWWTANINVQHLVKQETKAMTSLSSSKV